ncbi:MULTISPECIES: 50S ribosomal protein L32 [Emticicia]|uniref:Large ribosomal subunit protein bL32 n=1 Tax=Emticicia agri TaxID=2492393 RepID=A0A4Q5M077_9BACT|nr:MULTISPECIES: 50S ribosomal protein L32 [Emticicia]MBA4850302.1 50S ribosomal protein L32 [Emticicia sp. BO119]RYU95193.1 50S ribosomal protein L32 [Emticicia agri]
MAHPKRRHSTTRRDKRRTHDALSTKALAVDATTGEIHLRHRAHVFEGNLYYKGKLVVESYEKA